MSAHVPVLLVPGWSAAERLLAPLRARLVGAGWAENDVNALSFAEPRGSNLEHAREIGAAVDAVLAATGAEHIDIVAHSMGGLSARSYLDQGGAERVRRVVFLATPHRGTYSAYVAFGPGRREMIPGSGFLRALDRRPAVPPGIEAMTIRALLDIHILPQSSATLPGARDVRVCCVTHRGLLVSRRVFRAIHRFLMEGVTAATE